MKGLSLLQPWASLVAVGAKRFETRSWDTHYRGEIAIAASARIPSEVLSLCWDINFARAILLAFSKQTTESHHDDCSMAIRISKFLPRGSVVALATLAGTYRTNGSFIHEAGVWHEHAKGGPEQLLGNYSAGRFAWRLSDVRPLRNPVPCKGSLGLWNVSAELEAAIRKEL